jgi:predicted DNA-binding transcriptional regulator AlpA
MSLATLAEHIDSGESTIENWVKLGTFPKPVMQGGKRLWRWKDVERHLAGDVNRAPTDATRKALQGA